MRARLLKPWLRLMAVWWLGTTVWWAMSDERISAGVSRLVGHVVTVDAFNSGSQWLLTMLSWSLPVLGAVLIATALGSGAVWVVFALLSREQRHRVATDPVKSRWRGMGMNMGLLEMPVWADLPRTDIDIQTTGRLSTRMKAMTQAQRNLFGEVLATLAAHPHAFVGEGHTDSLLDHTLHVLQTLPEDCDDPLLPIAAAAHDAGKILSHRKGKDGQWEQVGYHDELGGLLVSSLPAAAGLPEEEFRILVLALRYAHKTNRTPIPQDAEAAERLSALQAAFTGADHAATASEKRDVLESIPRDKWLGIVGEAFDTALRHLPYQYKGCPKKPARGAFRSGQYVVLLEHAIRERMIVEIQQKDPKLAAAIPSRSRGAMALLTLDLIEVLKNRGWICTNLAGVEANHPLWNVQSGARTFKAVLIVQPPADVMTELPVETEYALTVLQAAFGLMLDRPFPLSPPKSKNNKPSEPEPVKTEENPSETFSDSKPSTPKEDKAEKDESNPSGEQIVEEAPAPESKRIQALKRRRTRTPT